MISLFHALIFNRCSVGTNERKNVPIRCFYVNKEYALLFHKQLQMMNITLLFDLIRRKVHERIFFFIQFKNDATLIKTPGYSGLAHPENVQVNRKKLCLLIRVIGNTDSPTNDACLDPRRSRR